MSLQNSFIHNRKKTYTPSEPIDLVYTWVNGSDAKFLADIGQYTVRPDESRYNDKNELKYSLRSIEKYAPWIRHIYIVTNGQIPHWLNLNHPQITVISHIDICPPQLIAKVLPTFSSFAIETFIHRIPNLSQRFLYFNDDVFLGRPLFLDHLSTDSEGWRIWNAWPLPNCADTCQWRFIGDGTCDLNCLTEMCHFDGGDCDNEQVDQGSMTALGKDYALVDDSRVKKIVINPNGDVPENYAFSDAPKIKVSKRKIKEESNMLEQQTTPETGNSLLKANTQNSEIMEKPSDDSTKGHFVQSLVYSNYILNEKYGVKERRMIAHVGFLLDRAVMKDMINKFPKEFNQTRSHRLRNGKQSIQLSFFYYNFLMSETKLETDIDIFAKFDTDESG